MPRYTVTWTVDIEAPTPRDAANAARAQQLDPQTEATRFLVEPVRVGAQVHLIDTNDGREQA